MLGLLPRIKWEGLQSELEEFLSKQFPHAVTRKEDIARRLPHDVFKSFHPAVLTFPSKWIIRDSNPNRLQQKVTNFLSGKIGCDYIIIDDHAYIEYFKPEHEEYISQVGDREIQSYRKRNGISEDVRQVSTEETS